MSIDYKKMLPVRDETGNKSTFGRVTVIAGSNGMAGASYLCALAVLRSGAGMVRIFTHEANRVILQELLPEALLTVYENVSEISSKLSDALKWADVIAIGPGLGTDSTAIRIVDKTLRFIQSGGEHHKPLVIDADALNVIAENEFDIPKGSCLTPHPGEMSRLSGFSIEDIKNSFSQIVVDFSKKYRSTLVLKDHNTLISSDGDGPVINSSGSSALAKAGSGDVLTGIIAAFAAQGLILRDAALLGVYLHGLSGEIAAEKYTDYGVLARDTANSIPYAIKHILSC